MDDEVKIIGLIYDLKRTLDSAAWSSPEELRGAQLMALHTILFVAEKSPYWGSRVMGFAEASHGS